MQRVLFAASVCITFGILTGTRGNAQDSSDGEDLHAGDFVKWDVAEFPAVANRWNLLRLSLSNSHDRPVDLQVAIYFDVDRTLQYSRQVQIPPATRIRTWLPILVPDSKSVTDRSYAYHVLVRSLGDSTGLLPNQSGSLQLDRTLQYESNEPATGVIFTYPPEKVLDTELVATADVSALDFLLTGRLNRGVRKNWRTLSTGFASAGALGMQALDQIVLANDELLDDPQGQDALRRWVFRGGHLWVMLDQCDSRNLELILGDRYQGQELERVELTSVEIVDQAGQGSAAYEYETPVAMTRLLIDHVDPLYSVDGWPAAFAIDYGQGQVLVTTLGANGWGRPRLPKDGKADVDTKLAMQAVPLPAFEEIVSQVLAEEDEQTADLNPVLTEQIEGTIGFRIPARASVTGVLMGYALLSAALAVWLWKTGRLPWFGVLGPALALLAAAALTGMRPAGRNVPSTAVVSQLVTPMTGSDDARARGIIGFYSTDASPLTLSGDETGMMMPDMDGLRKGIRILNFDDRFQWEWQKLGSQPGLHMAQFDWSGPLEQVDAIATPDERGLSGTLTLPDGFVPEDAIIDSAWGRIGVRFTEGGRWTARQSDTLSREQFLGADLLGDEQRRRVAILKQLMQTRARPWNSREPHLLFWTRPWDLDFELGDHFQQQGNALVAVPLQIQRPPSGSHITIPSPLLPYREVTGPDGKQPTGLYNRRRLEWMQKRYSTSTWLGFEIPAPLLPLTVDRVDVRIGVTGPVGQLELWKWDGRELVSLRRWEKPVGTLTASFGEDAGLSVSDDGTLLLFLSAGEATYDPTAPQDNPPSPWRIEFFDLSLEATATEPES